MVAVLGLPITLALAERVPNVNDVEIIEPAAGWPATFVALGHTTSADGHHTVQKAIWQSGPEGLLAHDEVRLLIAGGPVRLVRGAIRVPDTDCVYETAPGARLVTGVYLAFRRARPCAPQRDDGSRFELTLTFRGSGRISLATYFVPPDKIDPRWLMLSAPDPGDPRPVAAVRGRYADDLDDIPIRRVDLLAYVWNIAASPVWVWAVVGLALGAVGTGAIGLAPGGAASVARISGSVGAVGLGVAMLYVVLVPPLQAPDEPDHMLSFAQLAERPQLAESLTALARRGHFDRIHFHPAERFRQADVARPLAVDWDEQIVFGYAVGARSVTTWLWWKMLAPALRHATAAQAILAIRFANAVIVAACLALGAGVLYAIARAQVTAPHVVCLVLVLIPTLPFFATHVSEFAVLTSAYVAMAAIITAMFFDGERGHWLGLPLGVAAAAVLGGGRSGLPFVGTLAAACAGRALLGSPDATAGDTTRRALIFWIGLALGLALFPAMSTPDFRDGLWPADARNLPDWFRDSAESVRRHPWMIAIAIALGFGAEVALTWLRRRLPSPGRLSANVIRIGCALAAAAVVGSLLMSTVRQYPLLQPIEVGRASSPSAYVADVFSVAATTLRLRNHDMLLSTSFWGGFGWLDTMPGEAVVSGAVLLTALMLIMLLAHLARTASLRRTMWLATLVAGWSVTLALYAVSTYFLHRNLHGRYLVGLYLSVLAVCGSGLALLPRAPRTEPWWGAINRELILVVMVAGIHAYALWFILRRYF